MLRNFAVCLLILSLLSTIHVGLAVQTSMVDVFDTIYIRTDGSVEPIDAPIFTSDNVTYTLTANISTHAYFGIVIERDNIVLDGAGYSLEATWPYDLGRGIDLTNRNNVIIRNIRIAITNSIGGGIYLRNSSNIQIIQNEMEFCRVGIKSETYAGDNPPSLINGSVINNRIRGGWGGINLHNAHNNIICNNEITEQDEVGIDLVYSTNNTICGNNITNVSADHLGCIFLGHSSDNIIKENTLSDSRQAAGVSEAYDNHFYHNNFLNISRSPYTSSIVWDMGYYYEGHALSNNSWDDGYPSGGNYWSGYSGVDLFSGPSQNETSFDWIGDLPYVIYLNNTDRYPLMQPFDVGTEDLRVVYRSLLLNLHTVNSDLESMSTRVDELTSNMTGLQARYDSLEITINNLQLKITSLNSTVQSLEGELEDSTALLSNSINNLQTQLNTVNSTLQTSINNLQEQNTAVSNQLNNILYLLYVVTAIAAISVIALIYLAVRRPKISREST